MIYEWLIVIIKIDNIDIIENALSISIKSEFYDTSYEVNQDIRNKIKFSLNWILDNKTLKC